MNKLKQKYNWLLNALLWSAVGLGLFFVHKVQSDSYPIIYGFWANPQNDTNLAYSKSMTIDTNAGGFNKMSVSAIYSTTTATAVPSIAFIDGRVSTASIIITSFTVLSSAPATNTITINANSALQGSTASMTIAVTSNPYGVGATTWTLLWGGTTIYANVDWVIGSSSSTTAQNIAAALNRVGVYGTTATVPNLVASTVTLKATVAGTGFNNFTLVSSTPNGIVLSSGILQGGTDRVEFSLNGSTFMATASTLAAVGYFYVDPLFSSNTAVNLANAVNFSTYGVKVATTASTVVTFTAIKYGTAGNKFTLVSSSAAALTVLTPTFTAGLDAALLDIAGVRLVNGVDWSTNRTSSGAAKSLSDQMMVVPAIYQNLTSTWAMNAISSVAVIYCTSTLIGRNDILLFTSTQNALTISSGNLVNSTNIIAGITFSTFSDGSAQSYFLAGSTGAIVLVSSVTGIYYTSMTFIQAGNNFPVGLAVEFTTSAGVAPNPLITNTTYYVTNPTKAKFQLAYTSTGAVAGLPINISTFTQLGGGTFQVSPCTWSGLAPGFQYQVSNDSVSWSMVGASVTLAATSSATYSNQDFTAMDYRYFRIVSSAPAFGAFNLIVFVTGKP